MKQIKFTSKLKGKNYIINLDLRTRITIIADLSGTGKTLVRRLAVKENLGVVGFCSSDISTLQALLKTQTQRFDFKDKVVIIDNAEKLLKEVPELINCINYDRNNYYLVFLRQTSIPIEATPNSLGKLKFDDKTNTFYIEYTYKEGVWA